MTSSVATTMRGNSIIIEGVPGRRLLHSTDDAAQVVGACFEHHTRLVLLYSENLTERFFDLSSGEAGAVLQKFRNYSIKLAIVVPSDGARQSNMFRQMVAEENRGGDFRIFDDRDTAEAWLAGASARMSG